MSDRAVLPLSRVHATALVDPRAHLAEDVVVGPYCIVGPDVELGPGCELASHVRIDGPLVAGANNRFYHGAAIGGVPQDLKYSGARSRVEIGDHNVFREYVTVNRATEEGHATRSELTLFVHGGTRQTSAGSRCAFRAASRLPSDASRARQAGEAASHARPRRYDWSG